MGPKRTSRRELLKGGAVLAGGVTLGMPVHAQTHDHASGPASGRPVSDSRSTSGGPNLSWTIAFTGSCPFAVTPRRGDRY